MYLVRQLVPESNIALIKFTIGKYAFFAMIRISFTIFTIIIVGTCMIDIIASKKRNTFSTGTSLTATVQV